MKRSVKLLGVLVGVLVLIQLRRPERDNPPVTADVVAPPEVKAILKRACYDCHSHETVWPWYSNVAPISWMVARHVELGRYRLNFSAWESYDEKQKAHKLEELVDEVTEGEMPMPGYVALHSEAKLTDAEKATLLNWAKQPKAP
jgi:cytochrome c551/c552